MYIKWSLTCEVTSISGEMEVSVMQFQCMQPAAALLGKQANREATLALEGW